jgi:hypothetical protein
VNDPLYHYIFNFFWSLPNLLFFNKLLEDVKFRIKSSSDIGIDFEHFLSFITQNENHPLLLHVVRSFLTDWEIVWHSKCTSFFDICDLVLPSAFLKASVKSVIDNEISNGNAERLLWLLSMKTIQDTVLLHIETFSDQLLNPFISE